MVALVHSSPSLAPSLSNGKSSKQNSRPPTGIAPAIMVGYQRLMGLFPSSAYDLPLLLQTGRVTGCKEGVNATVCILSQTKLYVNAFDDRLSQRVRLGDPHVWACRVLTVLLLHGDGARSRAGSAECAHFVGWGSAAASPIGEFCGSCSLCRPTRPALDAAPTFHYNVVTM